MDKIAKEENKRLKDRTEFREWCETHLSDLERKGDDLDQETICQLALRSYILAIPGGPEMQLRVLTEFYFPIVGKYCHDIAPFIQLQHELLECIEDSSDDLSSNEDNWIAGDPQVNFTPGTTPIVNDIIVEQFYIKERK